MISTFEELENILERENIQQFYNSSSKIFKIVYLKMFPKPSAINTSRAINTSHKIARWFLLVFAYPCRCCRND